MKVSDLHPSKYIKSDDLRGKPHTVVISHLNLEDVGNNEKKWVMYFQHKPKGMVLNVTNSRRLAMFLGDETDNWTGKEIVVYPELTQDKTGKPVWGIRVRPPEERTTQINETHQQRGPIVERIPADAKTPVDLESDIPF